MAEQVGTSGITAGTFHPPAGGASSTGATAGPPTALKGKRKGKRKRRAKRSLDVRGTILMIAIMFVVVIALMLWIQSLFANLDNRVTETQRDVARLSAVGPAPSGSAASTGAAASNTGTRSAGPDPGAAAAPTQQTVIGRVVKAERKTNFWNVTVDPAQLLTGKAASSIASHRGKVPVNGQFLDDSTNTTRVIPCSEGAPVTTAGPPGGGTAPTSAKALFAALDGPDANYWKGQYFRMTIDSDYIVSYEQFTVGK
jgi:hypothetical protein